MLTGPGWSSPVDDHPDNAGPLDQGRHFLLVLYLRHVLNLQSPWQPTLRGKCKRVVRQRTVEV